MAPPDWFRKGLATTCMVMAQLYGSPTNAQATKASIESQASPTGLRHLVDTAILAARQQNEAELRKIIDALIIPRYDTWFVATFGQDQGGKMASLYGAHLAYEKSTLPWLFEKLTKREGELQIQDVATMAGGSPFR